MSNHTCTATTTTSDGSVLPPCLACRENFAATGDRFKRAPTPSPTDDAEQLAREHLQEWYSEWFGPGALVDKEVHDAYRTRVADLIRRVRSEERERMADASPRERDLETALLDCEHSALTAEDPKDMQDDVVAAVERVLGKPGTRTPPLQHLDTAAIDYARRMGAERDRFRKALCAIQAWDMLNPPDAAKLGDAPWLRSLVDDALTPHATATDGGTQK